LGRWRAVVGREASAVLAGVLAREETGFVAAVNLD